MLFWQYFIHRLLKGRSADQIERGFWTVVAVVMSVFTLALIAQALH